MSTGRGCHDTEVISYSGWDPYHIYGLDMRLEAGPYAGTFEMASGCITTNMSFVPAPEPATMLLLGLGLMGLAGVRRKLITKMV